MKVFGWIAIAIATLGFALILAGQAGLLAGRLPKRLGVTDGRLKPPSPTPNSVSSQADLYPEHVQLAYARMDPLRFTGDGPTAMERLAGIVAALPGANLVVREPDYLRAECSTPVLKFTDDVEFWLDRSAGVIHFRSSSRLGRKDFGVNRKRMEDIRAQFLRP